MIDTETLIEKLAELDVYYDNDYWTNNREPMLLRKDVIELINEMRTKGD